ncbi:MAG: YdbL family protein [bacterium]|nr:YdbL family protein [bacterium]
MRKQWFVGMLLVVFVAMFSGLIAMDQATKARFLKRKPVIDGMKNRGVVGENNLGILEFRGHVNPNERKIVDEENTDRNKVYAEISRSAGGNAQAVGKRRALKLAQIAAKGHWLQNPAGKWYRK